MKNFALILPILLFLAACGGGRNYLALSGQRCPTKFDVKVSDPKKMDEVVPFDINQLPVGEYQYTGSTVYYVEDKEVEPTMISVSETAIKVKDRKTDEIVTNYSENINCVRNIAPNQSLAFSYTMTTDFSIIESEGLNKSTFRSSQITTRVANVLMSQNTKGAIKPNFTSASNKEASDKLSKYIPEQTELMMYRTKGTDYELRTKTKLPNAEVISVIKYKYIIPN